MPPAIKSQESHQNETVTKILGGRESTTAKLMGNHGWGVLMKVLLLTANSKLDFRTH